MARPLALLLTLTACALAACGGDDDAQVAATAGSAAAPAAAVDLEEARRYLERATGVSLVRVALEAEGAPVSSEIQPEPVSSRRYETQQGRELTLLSFSTPEQARQAWDSVLETAIVQEDGRAYRAVNLIALFPRREGRPDDAYVQIRRALRDLAAACTSPDGDRQLRALCHEQGGGVPPAGEGVDTEEAAPIGASVQVGGVVYDVDTARQLNPRIAPDQELVDGRLPEDGALFFGVFLRACNEEGEPARTTDRLTLVNAFGKEIEPVDLPAGNPFAYEPMRLEADECLPETGTVADQAVDGRLVLFEFPDEQLQERPLGLRIVGPDGSDRATVELDV